MCYTFTMWLQDLRHGLRSLRARPVFALVAAGSLAAGIGVNSALFSFLYAIVLAPLPFPDSETVVVLQERVDGRAAGGSAQRWKDWLENDSVEAVTAWYGESMTLTGGRFPERVDALRTYGDLAATLALAPVLGRPFTPEEARGEVAALHLSHGFWTRRFGADPGALGESLRLNGRSYEIAGVLPASFSSELSDIVVPEASHGLARSARFLFQIARISADASLEQAQQSLSAQAARLRERHPESDAGLEVQLVTLREHLAEDVRAPLLALLGAVAFVLLSACLNVAGLLLQRATRRRGELAVRRALGASAWGLSRLLLAEGLVLAAAGGAGGLALALWGVDLLRSWAPRDLPRLAEVEVSLPVVAFTAALALATALLCSLAPAWRSARVDPSDALRGAGARLAPGRKRMQGVLLVSQVAISLALLFGAALLVRSFESLRARPLGFQPESLIAFQLPRSWQTPQDELNRFHRRVMDAVLAAPGVETVAFADRLPFEGGSNSGDPRVSGREPASLPQGQLARRQVSHDYLALLHVPLRSGRHLEQRDSAVTPGRAVINETAARLYFPGSDPLGQRIGIGFDPQDPAVLHPIVGVVGDLPQDEVDRQPVPAIYVPFDQGFWPIGSYVVRTSLELETSRELLQGALTRELPDQVVQGLRRVEGVVDAAVAAPRAFATLSSVFALVALLLAAVGLYGLLLNDVAERSVEIAIRLALGARSADVRRLILTSVLPLLGAGVLLGLALAAGLRGVLDSLLFGVGSGDPVSAGVSLAALLLAALLASLVPAERAARSNASELLRSDGA